MSYSIRFPWNKTERGQGFFVPCLDTESMRIKGLNAALRYRLRDARAVAGVRGDIIGVWFYRLGSRTDGQTPP